jgi:membrane protein
LRRSKAKAAIQPATAASANPSLWNLGGLTFPRLIQRLIDAIGEDELLTRSAALSFYFIFALFPMALSLLAVVGLFAQSYELRAGILSQFGKLMPASALDLVDKTIQELSIHSSRWKLVTGLVLAMWSGSSGTGCIMSALNRCYRVQDSRPYWKFKLIALALTTCNSALTLVALGTVLTGGDLAELLGARIGLSHVVVSLWHFAEWPIAFFFFLLSLALLYYAGPDRKQKWRWITPGSLLGVLGWVAASFLFRLYVSSFGTYSKSYGSLGAVMVLLLWLYLAGLAILAGGEVNAVIERENAS